MPQWVWYVLAIPVLAVILYLFARQGLMGRRAKGGVMMAGMLLGLGEVVDPPSKHLIEAKAGEEKDRPTPGDPPA